MRQHNILVVDDEPHILSAIKRVLQIDNSNVFTAESGEEGIRIMQQNHIDLIVSDYRMPGMNGVDMLKESKMYCPDAVRMILTGYADLNATIDAINEGEVYRFITKPWDNDELRLTVKNALAHYDVFQDNKILLQMVRKQSSTILDIEKQYPGITKKPDSQGGAYMIQDIDLPKGVTLEDFMHKYFPEEGGKE